MGIVSDAVHIFFDSLSIVIALIGLMLTVRQKAIRTKWRMYLLDDVLKRPNQLHPVLSPLRHSH
jgi:hypothetical protein